VWTAIDADDKQDRREGRNGTMALEASLMTGVLCPATGI
jgi:hypothetical protein